MNEPKPRLSLGCGNVFFQWSVDLARNVACQW